MSLKKIMLAVLFGTVSISVVAQGKLDSLQYLNEVEVTTIRPFKAVIPSQTLSGKMLNNLSSHSVADALRYFSGVKMKDYGGVGGLKTVDVRNMGSNHVGVFYDGLVVGNAQNGVTDLGKFSLDDIESISLYTGQKSELFQSAREYASAATIYLRSKKPRFEDGKKTNLIVRHKMMNINFNNPSLRLEQKLSDDLSLSVSSEYLRTPARYKFRYKYFGEDDTIESDTTGYRQNSDVESFRIETGLYGRVNDGLWNFKLYYYGSDRGSPSALVNNNWKNAFRQKDKNFFGQGSFTKEFSSKYKFQAKAKFAFDYMNFFARDTVNFVGETVTDGHQSDDSYYQQELYLSTVNMYTITPQWDVALSIDYQWNKLNATRRGIQTPFTYPTRSTLLVSLASTYNLGKLKILGSLVGAYVHESVKNNARPPHKRELSPGLFLGYKPFNNHDLNLRLYGKRVFRMPTFNELYYLEVGSSVLKPEFVNQFNLGFTYAKGFNHSFFKNFSIQSDVYYHHTKDKIVAAPTGTMFRWQMQNMGKTKAYGVETVARIDMKAGPVDLSTNLNYGYSVCRDYTPLDDKNKSSYGDQIPYTPWHSGSAIVNASYNTWNLNYSFIYVGKRYDSGVNNIKANEVQPWYTHDMSLQKAFKIKNIVAKGTVEVNNILDQNYEVVLNYPMMGRSFRFIVTLEI